jgi:hypothetical protein
MDRVARHPPARGENRFVPVGTLDLTRDSTGRTKGHRPPAVPRRGRWLFPFSKDCTAFPHANNLLPARIASYPPNLTGIPEDRRMRALIPVIPTGTMPVRGGTPAKGMAPRTAPVIPVMRVGTMIMTVALMVGPVTVARGAGMRLGGRARQDSAREHQHRHAQYRADSTVDPPHGAPHLSVVAESCHDSRIRCLFLLLPAQRDRRLILAVLPVERQRSGAARRLASSVNEREPPRAPRPGGQVSETSR